MKMKVGKMKSELQGIIEIKFYVDKIFPISIRILAIYMGIYVKIYRMPTPISNVGS